MANIILTLATAKVYAEHLNKKKSRFERFLLLYFVIRKVFQSTKILRFHCYNLTGFLLLSLTNRLPLTSDRVILNFSFEQTPG